MGQSPVISEIFLETFEAEFFSGLEAGLVFVVLMLPVEKFL